MDKKFILRVLFVQGFFVLGLGSGLLLGAVLQLPVKLGAFFLVFGALCLLASALLYYFAKKERFEGADPLRPRVLHLVETERALRAFGQQPELVRFANGRTEMLRISAALPCQLLETEEWLIENWNSPSFEVIGPFGKLILEPKQMLRISGCAHPHFELRATEETAYPVIHKLTVSFF